MTIVVAPLELDVNGHTVVLCDERVVNVPTFASVTLESKGERRGSEPLTREDVALVHAWTGALLAAAFENA